MRFLLCLHADLVRTVPVVVGDAGDAPVAVVCQGSVAVIVVLTVCISTVVEVQGTVVVQGLGSIRHLQEVVAVIFDAEVVNQPERTVVLHTFSLQCLNAAVSVV